MKALLVAFCVFFSSAVKCFLTIANILEGNRCAKLKVANPARDATLAATVVAQLSERRP